jgi:PAS domain S-box-containing protein
MPASHDPSLVALSVLISIMGAYAAWALSARVRACHGWTRVGWLVGGAIADGTGTWSMHYTAKLALRLPVPVLFDWPTVALSWLVGVVGAGAALLVLSRGDVRWGKVLLASVCMGGMGISGLHYTAMAAMRLPGMHRHHADALVSLSVVLAILIPVLALATSFRLLVGPPGHPLRYHGSAVLRGMANPVMHYTAMAAVTFEFTSETPDLTHAVRVETLGVLGISIVPVMVLVAALLTTLAGRLNRQRALLDELFEQAPQAVALLTVDGRVVRVNREFTRTFGYAPAEAAGRSLGELIVPEDAQEEERRHVAAAARGERIDRETVRRRKDGSRVEVAVLGVPVSVPGGQVEMYAIYRDISERRRAEGERRRQAEVLQTIFDHIPVMISFMDPTGHVQLVNREWERVLGWSLAEARMQDFLTQAYPDPLDHQHVAEYVRNPPAGWTDFRTRARDGRVIDTSWALVVLPDGTRIGIGLDVTDRRRAEAERDRLHREVTASRELLEVLSRRLIEAQEAERAHLARELHDEIGQVLTTVSLTLEAVRARAGPAAQDRLDESVRVVGRAVEQIRSLSLDLRPASLDLLGLETALRAYLNRQAARARLTLAFTSSLGDERLPPALETVCFRVVQEATTNVLRHARATRLEVELGRDEGGVRVVVRDDGVGFDVAAARERMLRGKGFGLLSMLERVQLFGGRIDIDSAPGRGTTIRLPFPRSGEADPPPP